MTYRCLLDLTNVCHLHDKRLHFTNVCHLTSPAKLIVSILEIMRIVSIPNLTTPPLRLFVRLDSEWQELERL